MPASRAFLWGALGAFVVLLAAAIIVPQYADYKERAANTQLYNETASLRQAVEARILGLGALENSGVGAKAPPEGDYKAMVTRDGVIILQGMRYGHIMVLTPSLDQGVVSWRCIGGPPKDMPRQCRGNK